MTKARKNPMPPDLSVVILCYRGGESVRPFIREVKRCLDLEMDNWELILVGNYKAGDRDPTPHIVAEIAAGNDRIKAVVDEKKGMMGWDVRSGLKWATGQFIALIDGDGQMPGKDIIRVYGVIKTKNYDMVKTYRITRYDGFYRRFISRVYNIVFSLLFPGLPVRDINAKPKVISRKAYEKLNLKSDDWFIDAEIMIQARQLGLRVFEIPAVFYALKDRRSFVQLPAILEFIKNLLIARLQSFR